MKFGQATVNHNLAIWVLRPLVTHRSVLKRCSLPLATSAGWIDSRPFDLHHSGSRDRVEQSLAALHQPSSFHLTAEDWHWLDENSDIENEFE